MNNIKRVAVIGGGSNGVAAAKFLLAENYFSHITVFEQRPCAGGVWNATPDAFSSSVPPGFFVPCTTPSTTVELPISSSAENENENEAPIFSSPVYPDLTTNVPYGLMAYDHFPFPDDGLIPLFPRHETILAYLKRYAEGVKDVVRYSTQVLDVHPLGPLGSGWSVTVGDLLTREVETMDWDAVVVANGHFNDVFVPDMEGLQDWKGEVTHSKFFRGADAYRDKKVLLIGNGASGTDISDQLAPFTSSLLISGHTPSKFPLVFPNIIELPEIASLDQSTQKIRFVNGVTHSDIDAIIFCTGYLYSFPFLQLAPSSLYPPVITNGKRVRNTFHHIFYRPDPTLSFIGLPQRVIPFPDAESQSSIVARVLSGRLQLPKEPEMKSWEEERVAQKGDGAAFHYMPFPEDADTMNELFSWAGTAEKRQGLQGSGRGLMPKWWGERDYWIREKVPALKGAVRKLNREGIGHKIMRMQELGFDFEEWKRSMAAVQKSPL